MPKNVFAATLLSTGFESGTLESWVTSGGATTATVSAEAVHQGLYAIKINSDKTSSYGFQTTVVNTEPGMFYTFSAFGKTTNTNTSGFLIRVAWYGSSDGSGSQLTTPTDSSASTNSDWTPLSTGVIQAPSTANSAKIRLILTTKTAGQVANAYFDDVVFEEAIAPSPTPTDTPVPPTATAIPKTPTFTPTPKPINTPTHSISLAPLSNTPTAISSFGAVLGTASAQPTLENKPTLVAAEADHKEISVQWMAIGIILLGFGLLGSCGILIVLQTAKGKAVWKRFF